MTVDHWQSPSLAPLRRRDHRARHTVAAVTARVGFIVVGLGVNHQAGAIGVGKGVGAGDTRAGDGEAGTCLAIRADRQIGEIAEVRAGRIVAAVLLARRVPMLAGAGEFGAFA